VLIPRPTCLAAIPYLLSIPAPFLGLPVPVPAYPCPACLPACLPAYLPARPGPCPSPWSGGPGVLAAGASDSSRSAPACVRACVRACVMFPGRRRPSRPSSCQDPAVWTPYLTRLAQGPAAAPAHLPPAAPGQPPAPAGAAAALNEPLTEGEVLDALKLLKNGRAPGAGGLPAELFRYARGGGEPPEYLLLPALTAMLDGWFRAGALPAAANVSLVVPVHKRGDASQPGNYCPIAVGEPAMRLYAALLNQRLVGYTEAEGLRAPSQAGFRPGMSTLHPVFTLQHLFDRARHRREPLFCCFLDLQGAYDRGPRPLLWEALARLGLHGAMPAAIHSLYTNAQYAISVGGRRGAGVPSARGVKQGCPLSPTLFGLLLDSLH